MPFNVIVVDPRNRNLVYAGSDTGLWVSGDAGATWQKVGPDRAKVRAYLSHLETPYAGVTGNTAFGANGDPKDKQMAMMRIQNRAIVAEAGQ